MVYPCVASSSDAIWLMRPLRPAKARGRTFHRAGREAAGLDAGGVERTTIEIAEALARAGHCALVASRVVSMTFIPLLAYYLLRPRRQPGDAAAARRAVRLRRFQQRLLRWYARHQRDLPWRKTRDPYAILVSEIMLQQTQVDRVIPKYHEFLQKYPTVKALASADPREVRRRIEIGAQRQLHDRQLGLRGGAVCHRVWAEETYCSSETHYADGAWHHVAVTVGAGGGKLYADGVLVAVGWTGQWHAEFEREGEGLHARAGLADTRFRLRPGEKVRGPRILALLWEGKRLHGHNMLRSLLTRRYLPPLQGKPQRPLVSVNVCFTHHGAGGFLEKATENEVLSLIPPFR